MVRPFAGLSIPDLLFFVSLLLLILKGFLEKKPFSLWFSFHPLWIGAYFIIVGGLLSSFNAVSQNTSILISIKQFYTFTFLISLAISITKKGKYNNLIFSFSLGLFVTSLVAISDFLFNTQIGYKLVSYFNPEINRIYYYRVGGTFGHPNELAMFIGVVFPIILGYILELIFSKVRQKLITIIFYIVTIFCSLLAVISTGSMTGILGVVTSSMIVLYFFLKRHLNNFGIKNIIFQGRIIFSIFLILFLFSIPFWEQSNFQEKVNSQNIIDRILTTTGPSRLVYIKESLNYIIVNPIIGAGMDQGGTGGLTDDQRVTSFYVHNTIIQSWVTGGFFAFLGAVLLYLLSFNYALKGINIYKNQKKSSEIFIALSASIISFILMDMVQANIYQRYKWLVVGILIGLISLYKKFPYTQNFSQKFSERFGK